MIEGKRNLEYKGLAVLVLLIVMMIPLSRTATANLDKQSQQTSGVSNLAAENAPAIFAAAYWAKSYGGNNFDIAYAIQNTSDGGYIVAGSTNSSGAGSNDAWVFKLNSTGSIVWQNSYGGIYYDDAASIQQTADGGYIVAGTTYSFGAQTGDFWLLKLNSGGSIAWQKTYGGSGDDEAYSVRQTSDGGYIVAGTTNSFGTPGYDAWVLKLNSAAGIVWSKTYGGSYFDIAYAIQNTSDGGYIVAGSTNSFDGGGYDHAWVLKLNSTGGITWQNTYGGYGNDEASSVQQTADGGYIVAGDTNSSGAYYDNFWVFKLDSNGSVVWSYTYGGSDYDDAYSVEQTADGGYIVAGTTYSFGAGFGDFWLLKLNSAGLVVWQNTYGGSDDDVAYSVRQTPDGDYIVAGTTASFGVGTYNVWVVKLVTDGGITWGPGSGASTSTTSVIPSVFNVAGSATSVTPVNSSTIVEGTSVTPQATTATWTEQSPETIGPPSLEIPLTIIIGAIAGVVLILAIVMVLRGRARSSVRTGPVSSPYQQRPSMGQVIICPYCGARNVPGAKFCKDCGASLERDT
jgi:uncharacterized delta-60 repeat protein